MIITNARVLTFDSSNRVLDPGAVEILPNGVIGKVRRVLPQALEERVIDARGRILMPALINCHTHLYSALARGVALPGAAPKNFPEILKKLWWRLDRVLNRDDIYYSAMVGLLDSARCGVGTLVDHHSSPGACPGSLDVIESAFDSVGLRGVACYETSDRNGRKGAAEGIRENVRFLEKPKRGLVRGAFGLHAAFTLSDRTLNECLEANESLKAGFHVHVSEDACDANAVTRLCQAGILDERSIAAHCVHVRSGEVNMLARRGVNVVHNPQSNCNNAVGEADILGLVRRKVLVGLGSDGYSPRMWDEFKTAFHIQKMKARDPRVAYAEAYALAFLNNRTIVKKMCGFNVGRIETGAAADLILVDYVPPTPMNSDNLFGHLLFGIANAPLDSLIVNGRFVVKGGKCVTVDEELIAAAASAQAKSLWRRFAQ